MPVTNGDAGSLLAIIIAGVLPNVHGCSQYTDKFPLNAVQTVNGPQSFHLAWSPPPCNDASANATTIIGYVQIDFESILHWIWSILRRKQLTVVIISASRCDCHKDSVPD